MARTERAFKRMTDERLQAARSENEAENQNLMAEIDNIRSRQREINDENTLMQAEFVARGIPWR